MLALEGLLASCIDRASLLAYLVFGYTHVSFLEI